MSDIPVSTLISFGCKIRSKLNGVIFNSEMDDFSVPSHNNTYDLPPTRSA